MIYVNELILILLLHLILTSFNARKSLEMYTKWIQSAHKKYIIVGVGGGIHTMENKDTNAG